MKVSKIIIVCAFSLLLLASSFVYSDNQVLVNRPASDLDLRYDYPHELLALILQTTNVSYGEAKVTRSPSGMSRARQLLELERGELLHVVAEAPKPAWVKKLITIRIPIRKGIQGYRLFLIKRNDQHVFDNVRTIDDFKLISTGSGAGWSTTRVLLENGFTTVLGTDYEGLFAMLMKGRFKSFGRGLNEITPEYNNHIDKFPELAIEAGHALYIPLPTYFFVSPKKPKLARRIEQGLLELIKDGSFDELFDQHHAELIESSGLRSRTVFKVDNPNLSDLDPLDKHEFWLSLD